MTSIDVHQHLLPPALVGVLQRRTSPPRITVGMLELVEGSFPFDPRENDAEERLAVLDREGIDLAVLSLQPTLGYDALPDAERTELVAAWEEGVLEIVAASGGRFAALAAGLARPGFVGACVGSAALTDAAVLESAPAALAENGGFLFVHPSGGAVPPGRPAWWGALTLYTAQMQAAYLAWLTDGQSRWPEIPVVLGILAGGGPFQLERLASRGVDVRSNLHPNVFFDTASYGRRALELCIETFGVEQLVYGSDLPVVDPEPTARAIRGFGESVETLLRQDTPARLLP
jgi:hypothetical protein